MMNKVIENQKNIFWEALIVAVFIFGCGILLGIFVENNRASDVSDMYLRSEIDLTDVKVQTEILNLDDLNCENAIQKNIEFGDRIYEEAKQLDKYEEASDLTNSLLEQHRRYNILRTLFWLNSIKIKEKCSEEFHTIAYDQKPESEEQKSKQVVFSRFLGDLKQEKGNKILLIPISRSFNLTSVDLLLSNYHINETSIIVDEDLIVDKIEDLGKINDLLA